MTLNKEVEKYLKNYNYLNEEKQNSIKIFDKMIAKSNYEFVSSITEVSVGDILDLNKRDNFRVEGYRIKLGTQEERKDLVLVYVIGHYYRYNNINSGRKDSMLIYSSNPDLVRPTEYTIRNYAKRK